jgi:hypothetical protein
MIFSLHSICIYVGNINYVCISGNINLNIKRQVYFLGAFKSVFAYSKPYIAQISYLHK